MIAPHAFDQGLALLRQPLLPLASIVQFIYLTGEFTAISEVIAELPEEIETGYAAYQRPAALLAPHAEVFRPLEEVKAGKPLAVEVVDIQGNPVDALTAASAFTAQQLLTRELARINSLLCAPCGCTLCCTGPEAAMAQHYFEIPLTAEETARFGLARIDTAASRASRADAGEPLTLDSRPFYDRSEPLLIRWQPGWSLILPREQRCPQLEESGRCRIYPDRPTVCRRPQIFPYVLEPIGETGRETYRLRQSLLAVLDCPYVQALKEEIAAFAAASELEMIFRHNKG